MSKFRPTPKTTLPPAYENYKAGLSCNLLSLDECDVVSVGSVRGALFCLRGSLGRTYTDTAGQVIGFENNLVSEWVNLYFIPLSGSFTTNWDRQAAGDRYASTLGFEVRRNETLRRNTLLRLFQNGVTAIVFDANGAAWLAGDVFPFRVGSASSQTGQALGENNGYSFTLNTVDAVPPRVVTKDALDALVLNYQQNCALPYNQALPVLSLQACEIDAYSSIII